jgi:hypothetical protein
MQLQLRFILFAPALFFSIASFHCGPARDDISQRSGNTHLTDYLNETSWDSLFPNRYGVSHTGVDSAGPGKTDFYSFAAFVAAATKYPAFLDQGTDTDKRRELAAFLANCAQETSGGWEGAPGGYFKWGFYFIREQGCDGGCPQYSDSSKKKYPPVSGRSYYGRGPKQLSYNYNYGQFSQDYFGDKEVLLQDPDRVARDSVLAFASALWFWMTPQPPKPSCHDVITGIWHPTHHDQQAGRLPGFGTTLNIINGGVECGHSPLDKTVYRYEYYKYFCKIFKVTPGPNVDCADQVPFTAESAE